MIKIPETINSEAKFFLFYYLPVHEVVLQQSESDWLDVVDAGKDLDAIHGVVVVLVVEEDPLLDDDLLLRVANVDQAEVVVGDGDSLDRVEGGELGLSHLARQDGGADSDAHVVLDLVVEHVHRLGRRDDVDAVVGGVRDVDRGKQRGRHHGLDGRRFFSMQNSGTDHL